MNRVLQNKHVVLGLSGGVDSAVAGLLLREQGYHVTALFMKNWEEDDSNGHCSAAEDLKEAKLVCEQLDIPLQTVNFASEYWDRVFEYFLEEYKANRTPNPDVLCNKEIKFKAFLDYALSLGADKIAMGHYAGVEEHDGQFQLTKAVDTGKDQTYFLHTLGQYELSRSLFPLAQLTKQEVRERAEAAGLPNFDRKDSTGICFIGERDFKSFLNRYLPMQPGDIYTPEGEFRGKHSGLVFLTIGQRQGLGIGGPGGPWYVAGKNIENNTLIVVEGENHPALFSEGLSAININWVAGHPPLFPLHCTARIRHRQPEQACIVEMNPDNTLKVMFDQPQRAITPGQSVVFYNNNLCLGGGIIGQAITSSTNSDLNNNTGLVNTG